MVSQATFTFDEAKHEYTLPSGLVIPSTTQVLRRVNLVSFEHVRADVLENKRGLGKAVHKITEFLDVEMADVPRDEIEFESITPVDAQPRCRAWEKFKRESKVEILGVEIQMVGEVNGMPYGMTPDRIAIVNGREAVLDIKNSEQKQEWEGIQLASYDMGLPPTESQLHRDRYSVHLRADGSYRLVPFTDEGDYDMWQWALALTWGMLNRKYKLEDVETVQ